MKKVLQNPVYFLSCLIFLIASAFLAYLTYSNLDKGFIFNDEAYYLSYYSNNGDYLSFDRTNFSEYLSFYTLRIFIISELYLSQLSL
ncbi:hypothetical protein [Chryseobacterium wanjuense]